MASNFRRNAVRPCKFFSVFLVRVRHETLCGRAEKTNNTPEKNRQERRFVLFSRVAASLHDKPLVKNAELSALAMDYSEAKWDLGTLLCQWGRGWGPVRIRHSSHAFGWQSSHSVDLAGWQAKMASIDIWIPWRNAHKPHCRTKDQTEDVSKTRLSSRRMDNSVLNQAHNGLCALGLDVSHMPPSILSVFSYSWPSEKKRVRRRVRPGLLPSPITTIKRGAVIPSTGSLFSLLFLFW